MEKLGEQARNKYRELSEEKKNAKREYGRNRCHNMSGDKKQRLREYLKILKSLSSVISILISKTTNSFLIIRI